MAILNLKSNNIQNPQPGVLLSDIVYVPTKVIKFTQDPSSPFLDNTDEFKRNESIENRKYNLNDPYEYGAFVEDSLSGFVDEQIASNIGNAYTELKNKNTTVERKQQILESGRPYPYSNTKRLALVKQDNSIYVILNVATPTVYHYDYDNQCERLDFDSKVVPGVNANDPTSPCNVMPPEPDQTGSFLEIAFISGGFSDFDDYRDGYKTEFNEIGYRTDRTSPFIAFSPKRFEYVKQNLIIDEFEDVISGPIRVQEEVVSELGIESQVDLVIYQQIQKRNKRTGEIISGSGDEVEVFRRTLTQIPSSIFIFKQLQGDSIRSTPLYNMTDGVWNGNGSLYDFYTSSIQSELEKSYKLEVISGSCLPNKMFTIYYGNNNGGGTKKISDDRQKLGYSKSVYSMFLSMLTRNDRNKTISVGDYSVSQSLYIESQLKLTENLKITDFLNTNFRISNTFEFDANYENDVIYASGSEFYLKKDLAVNPDSIQQLFPKRNLSSFYAIQINPKLLRDSIDEGNFQLALAQISSSGTPEPEFDPFTPVLPPVGGWGVSLSVDMDSDKVITLIDNSRLYDSNNEYDSRDALRYNSSYTTKAVFDLVSGSLEDGVYQNQNPIVYGTVYPSYGIIILDAEKLNQELNYSIVDTLNVNGENPRRLYTSIAGAALQTNMRSKTYPFIMRNASTGIVDTIEISVDKNEFNYSTNPSYYNSKLRSPFFRTNQPAISNGKSVDEYTFVFRQFYFEPMSYITSIGLYNDNYELLAVGKLSKPIKKTIYDSVKFKVNLVY